MIDICEEAALVSGKDPNYILAEALYLSHKKASDLGTDICTTKILDHYPIINEVIR